MSCWTTVAVHPPMSWGNEDPIALDGHFGGPWTQARQTPSHTYPHQSCAPSATHHNNREDLEVSRSMADREHGAPLKGQTTCGRKMSLRPRTFLKRDWTPSYWTRTLVLTHPISRMGGLRPAQGLGEAGAPGSRVLVTWHEPHTPPCGSPRLAVST